MENRGVLQNLLGVGEAGLALGSGYLSGITSGWQGLGAGLGAQAGAIRMGHNPFDPNVWLGPATQAIREGGTPVYQPRTEAGQQALSAVSVPFGLWEQGADWAGGKTAEATNPELGATLYTILMGARKPGKASTVWSSPLEKALSTTQAKGDAGHYISALKKEKGALAEAKMSGLLDVLESSPKHTREGLLNHPRMALTETVKGDDSYALGLLTEATDKRQAVGVRLRNRVQDITGLVLPQSMIVRTVIQWERWLREWGQNLAGDSEITGLLSEMRRYDGQMERLALKSPTKYGSSKQLNLPGGTNPKEILVQLPTPYVRYEERFAEIAAKHGRTANPEGYIDYATSEEIQELESLATDANDAAKNMYTDDPHWDEDNVLVHVRTNERYVGGKKALHGEEIQSQWHQQGQKKGYIPTTPLEENVKEWYRGTIGGQEKSWEELSDWEKTNVTDSYADLSPGKLRDMVPDAPYKKDWHELGFKRLLAEAIRDPSIERLTWTTGEVQADRYNLAKYIDRIEVARDVDAGLSVYELAISHKDGHIQHETSILPEDLEEFVGKEMADKIVSSPEAEFPEWLVDAAVKGTHGRRGLPEEYAREAVEALWENPRDTPMRGTTHHFLELRRVLPEDVDLNQIFYDNRGTSEIYSGLDLEIGGEFHKQLYNQKITKFAKEWLKKFKVKPQRISDSEDLSEYEILPDDETPDRTDDQHDVWRNDEFIKSFPNKKEAQKWLDQEEKLWYIDITPKMREYFFKHGIPLAEVDQLQQAYA
jgi:hypothetical protein